LIWCLAPTLTVLHLYRGVSMYEMMTGTSF